MMKEEEMIEETAEFLHGYLKSGKVKVNSFITKINTNIKNLNELLKVRFLLQKQTIQFVTDLPFLLKNIKTTTTMQHDTYYGEVRGQINWGETIKERLARNYKDRTIFTTDESVRSYNTPENLLLKQLLSELYIMLYKDSYINHFEQMPWFSEWNQLKENVAQAYRKNIYLQRVSQTGVTDRVIQKTLSHRNILYRQAAQLLFSYRRLMSGKYSEDDLKAILKATFITPDNVNVLFELYWIVQLIKNHTDESELYLIDGTQNIVASWEKGEQIFKLYHDSSGSSNITFNVQKHDIQHSHNTYLQQKYKSFTMFNTLKYDFFNTTATTSIWSGRPDFLLEGYDKQSGKLTSLTIGEIKNSRHIDYVIQGLEELIDYIYYVKNHKGDYLQTTGVKIDGILCSRDVPVNKSNNHPLIKIVTNPNDLK